MVSSPNRGQVKKKIMEPSVSQVIRNLVPLLAQEAARFKDVADVEDKLKSILASLEDADLNQEKSLEQIYTEVADVRRSTEVADVRCSPEVADVEHKLESILPSLEYADFPKVAVPCWKFLSSAAKFLFSFRFCSSGPDLNEDAARFQDVPIDSGGKSESILPVLEDADLNQEAARFKEVADVEDKLESILAILEDLDLKAEKEGNGAGENVAHDIQDAIAEYNSQHRDRHGFIALVQRIDLLVKKLKPEGSTGSIDFDGSTKNLFKYAQLEFEVFNSELVKKAAKYVVEKNLNRGNVDHLICTAILLASSTNSDAVVASGLLLHDSLCDTKPKYKALKKEFGSEIAKLVRDVSKLNKLSKISREEDLGNFEPTPDLILAMVGDARAVMIKIAERTVQMLALDTSNSKTKQRFVNETLHVYVPLSERLSFNLWKSQLENLCVSASDELKKLYESISEYDVDGIAFEVKLRDALKGKKMTDFRVESRKKSLLSILNKMTKYRSLEKEKNKMSAEDSILFSKIRDIIGLRIIVENEKECYQAKDVVQNLWKPEPNFEKDYIKNPKPDGYKSLHLCVKNAKDQYKEIQIRTKEMHVASNDAHWLYKEGSLQVSEHVKTWVEFARLVNKQAKGKTTTLSNTLAHHPKCPYAKIDKPPCLDANRDCKFPGKRPVYVIVKGKNEVTIEEYSTDSKLKDLCWPEGLQGEVLVNAVQEGLNYTLRAGDIIEFV